MSAITASSTLVNAPQYLPAFFGRKDEIAAVSALLADPHCRLLTLVGPGGMGKTRLAIEAATRLGASFPDGAFFVPLQPLASLSLIPAAMAEATGFTFTGRGDPADQLTRYLSSRQALLVLDNYEHLVESVDQVTALLHTAPGVKLLVTSREVLNLQDEWLYPLKGLSYPGDVTGGDLSEFTAVQLFADRARHVQRAFDLEAEAAEVVHICQLVEGMPLAIELAAAWRKSLTSAEIAAEIQRSLDILTTTLRDLPDRHRSMQAVFEPSWNYLSPEEQQVFMRLSVFRGGFTSAAAAEVAEASLPALAGLVDKSLLWREEGGRYQVHELLRQYAAARLAEEPDRVQALGERHAIFYLQQLTDLRQDIFTGRQQQAIAGIQAEIDNLRAAWDWAVANARLDDLFQAAMVYDMYFQAQSRFQEGLQVFEGVAERLAGLPPTREVSQALAAMLVNAGWFAIRLGEFDKARRLKEESRAIYRAQELTIPPGLGSDPAAGLAMLASLQGDYARALELGEAARQASLGRIDRENQAFAEYVLTSAHLARGAYAEARQHGQQAYRLAHSLGDRWFVAYCLNELGNAERALHNYAEAVRLFRESYEIRRSFNDPEGMAVALGHLGRLAILQGDYGAAARLYRESCAIYRRINDQGGLASSLNGAGLAASRMGQPGAAAEHFLQALEIAERIQFIPLSLAILANVAGWLRDQGEADLATRLLALVRGHPASDQETRERAAELSNGLPDAQPETDLPSALQLARQVLGTLEAPESLVALSPAPGAASAPAEQDLIEPLSERELEILGLIAQGQTNKAIAGALYLSPGTVKWYTSQIYAKLNVSSRTAAVARARQLGLLE